MRAYARKYGEDEHDAGGWSGCCTTSTTSAGRRPTTTPTRRGDPGKPGLPRVVPPRDPVPRGLHRSEARDALEKTLFACDELCGFLTACALVTPTRSLADVKLKSVKKKMKSKAFAASVNRDDITQGAAELGVELDAHIEFVLEALRAVAQELGLDGP